MTAITSKPLLASFRIPYRIAKCKKKLNRIQESLVLPAAIGNTESVNQVAKSSEKSHLQTTVQEEEYGVLRKTFVINWLINLTPRVLLCK
jgi:TusA-related sulfurtransferase